MKSHENPSSGSRAAQCRWMEEGTDRQTDKVKPRVTFCKFVNMPKRGIGQDKTVSGTHHERMWESGSVISVETIPLCLLLNKIYLFSVR